MRSATRQTVFLLLATTMTVTIAADREARTLLCKLAGHHKAEPTRAARDHYRAVLKVHPVASS